jgi:two-component system, sensor histidine kinase FlrB
MTCLPTPACDHPPVVSAAVRSSKHCEEALVNIGKLGANLQSNDEHSLLRAFRNFSEVALSLEHSYGELQGEVGRLRRELEVSRAGLERSLEQNRRMRSRLNRILASLPCGVLVASGTGEITHLNAEGAHLLGRTGDPIRTRCRLVDIAPAVREILERSRQSECEAEASRPDERGRWLAARYAKLGESDEENGSSVFILQDVTERKHLEQAEQKLHREQALAEMSTLLAHEIRNPLGSLELFAGLLAESGIEAESKKWIGHIQAGLRTLGATVNNVLHFHSLPEPELTAVDLGCLLDWAQGFLAPLAQQAHVDLRSEHALDGVEIAADRHRLEQVLLNLVLNAIKATPEGGAIRLGGTRNEEGIVITVSDTGRGIPPECRERIFEPGFSTRSASPGLGLAVCRKIVDQHGGTITVESRPGEGAIFTLRFPLRRKPSKGVQP